MHQDTYHKGLFERLKEWAEKIEEHLNSDVIFYSGVIAPFVVKPLRDLIENLKPKSSRDCISVFLRTNGGSAEVSEQMVNILRHHYEHVNFIVPDYAMSAGTILCLSGDKIYMDYVSCLGPIDPQVVTTSGEYVAAMGYLDEVQKISTKESLTESDVIFLSRLDLGCLAEYEQAQNLSITLLKDWLVKYKFKDWTEHSTHNVGECVTSEEKETRAERIAELLSDNKKWLSHGRALGIEKLQELGIKIDDYSGEEELRDLIRLFNDTLVWHLDTQGVPWYFYHKTHKI